MTEACGFTTVVPHPVGVSTQGVPRPLREPTKSTRQLPSPFDTAWPTKTTDQRRRHVTVLSAPLLPRTGTGRGTFAELSVEVRSQELPHVARNYKKVD